MKKESHKLLIWFTKVSFIIRELKILLVFYYLIVFKKGCLRLLNSIKSYGAGGHRGCILEKRSKDL